MHNEQENHPPLPEQNDGLNHIDADSGEATPDVPKDKASGKASKWRWLGGGLLALMTLLILLIGSVLIAAQSERGTRALWRATKVLSGGHVQSQWISGSLAHGGSAQSMQIHLSTVHIDIFELSGDWRWSVLPVHWQVDRLAAQRLDITLLPSEKKSKPLEQITMPLAFTVNDLSVPQVNLIQGLQTTELKDVSGSVSTDKVQHHINLTHLRQGGAEYSGQLAFNGKKPFVLDGQIDAVLHDEYNDYSAKLIGSGDLKHLNLDLSANSGTDGNNRGDLQGQGNLSVQLLDGQSEIILGEPADGRFGCGFEYQSDQF